jgi:hypothetical protein
MWVGVSGAVAPDRSTLHQQQRRPDNPRLRMSLGDQLRTVNLFTQYLGVAQFASHYHEGHEGTRRKLLQINPFVTLRVLM